MPLVAHSALPTFDRLRGEGHEILDPARARRQDIRELHVGFLNLMPDAALAATERQFLRLVGASNRIAQLFVHPFTMAGVDREGAARERVERYYEPFERLKREGLDALIVTGANVTEADLTREAFWEPLIEVMAWGRENVASMLCSCLTSHAAFQWLHGVRRTHLPAKRWGVYSHRVTDRSHPLVAGINTRFETPHSRFNDVARAEMEAAGLRVLVESEQGGVLVATSPDGFRFVYFQGHPEYDRESLLKEYKREVGRYLRGERDDYPPSPENYFPAGVERRFAAYREEVERARAAGAPPPGFPEEEVLPDLDNTWTDTGKALVNNWLGLVYQLTDYDRRRPFAPGVDPADPLGLGPGPGRGRDRDRDGPAEAPSPARAGPRAG